MGKNDGSRWTVDTGQKPLSVGMFELGIKDLIRSTLFYFNFFQRLKSSDFESCRFGKLNFCTFCIFMTKNVFTTHFYIFSHTDPIWITSKSLSNI